MATTLKYKRLNKKDVKIFFSIVLCLFIVSCKRSPVVVQDRANIKISELPAASSLDTNDLFIVSDAGTVSRSLKGRKIADAISDSAYRIRFEIDSAKTNIRSEGLGGSGAWTKSGNFVSLLVNTDTVGIGSNPVDKLNIRGGIYAIGGNATFTYDGTTGGIIHASQLSLNQRLNGSGLITSFGDDMYFFDNSTGAVKLSDLASSGGHFTLTNSTITPTLPAYNLNIGSLNETTRKLKVNGSFEVTQDVHLGAGNYDVYLNDHVNLRLDESSRILFSNTGSSDNLALYPVGSHGLRINNYYYTNGSYLDINTNYGLYGKEITDEHNVGIRWDSDSTMSFITYNSGNAGTMNFNGDSIHIVNVAEGLDYWIGTTITGGGGGAGVVDTAGGQNTNMVPYWTDKNTLGGTSIFTYGSPTNTLIVPFIQLNTSTGPYGIKFGSGPVISGAGDTIYIHNSLRVDKYLKCYDSIYYMPFAGVEAGKIWWTNSVTGGIDSANTEPAYIGWEMDDLPTLEEYEKDVKMINGHMERRIWYIDYETKELKSQYGWDGLGMMNTQSAYMIYHEITVRWMFEQNKKIAELQKVQIPSDVMNITRALNGVIYGVFTLFGLFILLIAFSIAINRK